MFKKMICVMGVSLSMLFLTAASACAFDLDFSVGEVEFLDSGFIRASFAWSTTGSGMQPGSFLAVESTYMIEREPNGQLNYLSSAPVTRRDFYGHEYQLHAHVRNYRTGRSGWYSSGWISVGVFPGGVYPNQPVWNHPSGEMSVGAGAEIPIDWGTDGYARIYEVQAASTPSFDDLEAQFWPSDPFESVTGFDPGIYYFRVRAWNALPERYGSLTSDWSEVLTVIVGDFSAPVILPISHQAVNGSVLIDWTDVPASRIYELVEYSDPACSVPSGRSFWPQVSEERVSAVHSGTFYYRVRAWSAVAEDGRRSTDWSNIVSFTVAGLDTPVIQPIEPMLLWETLRIEWADVPGATLYQLIEYSDANATHETGRQFWPSSSTELIRYHSPGEYYYRVRAWSAAPEQGGISSAFSEITRVSILPISGPTVTAAESVHFMDGVGIAWTDIPEVTIYQLVEYRDEACLDSTGRQFWPSAAYEHVQYEAPARFFYRVRGWNESPSEWSMIFSVDAMPDTPVLVAPAGPVPTDAFSIAWVDSNAEAAVDYYVGAFRVENDVRHDIGILAEVHEKSAVITIPEAGEYELYVGARSLDRRVTPVVSDVVPVSVFDEEALLNDIKRRAFDYFIETTFVDTGLARDKFPVDMPGTVEQTGQVDTDTVSTAACGFYLSVLTVGVENGWIGEDEARNRARRTLETFWDVTPNHHGFFYHYLNPDGSVSEYPVHEVSTIDTALFLSGALQAGEFFGGDVQELAEELYERVQWSRLFNGYTNLFHMGWSEERGAFGEYDAYSEAILLYLLAIGSPTDPVPAESFYNFMRDTAAYGEGEKFIYNYFGQLFTYQFPHAWFDFEDLSDALGVNWYVNSRRAVKANQEYCRDQGYDEYYWGISAALADTRSFPSGYAPFGAQPAEKNTADGTIAPYAVIASLPFDEDPAMDGIEYLAYGLRDQVWNDYGFADSINTAREWCADSYLGIDQGIICLMLENVSSRTIWDSFMGSQHVSRALIRTRFSGFGPSLAIAEGFEADTFWDPQNALGWWAIDGGYVYQFSHEYKRTHSGERALRVTYNKYDRAWSLFAGHIGPDNPLRDMTEKTKLCFWVSGEVELLVKLRDRTFAEVELGTVTTTTSEAWTYVEFDLSTITGVNTSDIDTILFFAHPGKEALSGSFVIDTIVVE